MCRVATTGNANIPFLLLAPPSCNLEHLGEVERHKSHFLVLWQIRKYKRYKYPLRPIFVTLPNTKNNRWNSCQISDNSIQSFSSLSVWLTRLLKRQSGLVICMRAVRNGHRGNWANNWVFVPPCAQQSEKVMPRPNWAWNVDWHWLNNSGFTALHFTH